MNEADKIMEVFERLMTTDVPMREANNSMREVIEWALLEAYAEGRKDERAERFPGVDIDAVHRSADLVRQQGTGA